jgi:hypothetical protein
MSVDVFGRIYPTFAVHPRPGRTRRRFGALVLGMLIDAIFTAVTNRVRARRGLTGF